MSKAFFSICIVHRPSHFHLTEFVLKKISLKLGKIYITDDKNCYKYLKLLKLNALFFPLAPQKKIISNPVFLLIYICLFAFTRALLLVINDRINIFLCHDYNPLSLLFAAKNQYNFIQDGLGLENSVNNKNSNAYRNSKIPFFSPSKYYGRHAKSLWLRKSCNFNNKNFFIKSRINFYDEKLIFNDFNLNSFSIKSNLIYPPKSSLILIGNKVQDDFNFIFFNELKRFNKTRNLYFKPHPHGDFSKLISLNKNVIPSFIPIELFDIKDADYLFISIYSSTNMINNLHLRFLDYDSLVDDQIILSKEEFASKLVSFLQRNSRFF